MNRIGIIFVVSISFLLALLALPATGHAQQPTVGAAVNAASYAIAGLPGSGIAKGGMFIVFGTNMGPAAIERASSFPLPTNLAGTSIKVTVSGTTTDAIILYTRNDQVAAVMRSNTPAGTGTLTLTYNGSTSAPAAVTVVAASFGAFTLNQQGTGAAVILDANNQPIDALHPAAPGQTVALWGTGLGPVSGDETQAPPAGNLATSVEVLVGSSTAAVVYKGRAPCCVGIDQVNFVVPQGLSGCTISVVIKINSVVSNFATLAVSNGGPCSDPTGLTSENLQRLQSQGNLRIGSVFLSKGTTPSFNPDGSSTTLAVEAGGGSFLRVDQQELLRSQGSFNQVSIGGCVVSTFSGQSAEDPSFTAPTYLDAGASLSANGPNGSRQIPKIAGFAGAYSEAFNIPPAPASFLSAGSYTVSGPGGADVGPFQATFTIGAPLNWTNSTVINIPRGQNHTIRWTGGPANGLIVIGGTSYVLNADNTSFGATFYCLVESNPGQFTIPSAVLLALPASSTIGFPPFQFSTGALFVGAYIFTEFTASGLDQGYAGYVENLTQFVNYQ